MTVDKRILKMHALIKSQYDLGIASDEAMQEANSIMADAQRAAKAAQPQYMTGDRIRALRTRYKLSQSQLASRLYLSANCVQKWERDVTHPKGAALAMLEIIEKKGPAYLD